jgi:hypothetical protein
MSTKPVKGTAKLTWVKQKKEDNKQGKSKS